MDYHGDLQVSLYFMDSQDYHGNSQDYHRNSLTEGRKKREAAVATSLSLLRLKSFWCRIYLFEVVANRFGNTVRCISISIRIRCFRHFFMFH